MVTTIQTTASCKTDPGLRRSHNEDRCFVDNQKGYFLVADGIGGAAAGEIASAIFAKTTVDTFSSRPERTTEETLKIVSICFRSANSAILADIAATPSHLGMGCTAELLALQQDGFVLGHIGDSRTYLLRNKVLTRLTTDHSLVQQQLDLGLITAEEAKNHLLKNVILKAVGTEEQLEADIRQGHLEKGDLFLLCSDGLTDMVEEGRIHEVLLTEASLEQKAEELVKLANEAGGRDNITVVLVEA